MRAINGIALQTLKSLDYCLVCSWVALETCALYVCGPVELMDNTTALWNGPLVETFNSGKLNVHHAAVVE